LTRCAIWNSAGGEYQLTDAIAADAPAFGLAGFSFPAHADAADRMPVVGAAGWN
jgi:hypothetical protein